MWNTEQEEEEEMIDLNVIRFLDFGLGSRGTDSKNVVVFCLLHHLRLSDPIRSVFMNYFTLSIQIPPLSTVDLRVRISQPRTKRIHR